MPEAAHDASRAPRRPAQVLFVAIMVLWLVLPLVSFRDLAWDTIPLLTAGEIVLDEPDEVYASRRGGPNDMTPYFLERWCEASGQHPECRDIAVPYVNTPLVLPIAVGLAAIGRVPTALLFDLCSALALVGGMAVLWSRLTRRNRRAEMPLALAAVALTPMAMVPVSIGQLSTLMFLSVCLGMSGTTPRRRLADAGAWVAASVVKVTPAPLVLLLVARRRWRMLTIAAVTVAVLFVASLFVAPFDIWFDFVTNTTTLDAIVRSNHEVAGGDNFYAGSVAWLASQILPGSQAAGLGGAAVRLGCAVAALVICVIGMRATHDDNRWAVGYLALLWIAPLLWSHYLWVVFGAVAVALSLHPRAARTAPWVLVGFAVLLGFEGLLTQSGRAIEVLRPVSLIIGTVATLWFITDARATARRRGARSGVPKGAGGRPSRPAQ